MEKIEDKFIDYLKEQKERGSIPGEGMAAYMAWIAQKRIDFDRKIVDENVYPSEQASTPFAE